MKIGSIKEKVFTVLTLLMLEMEREHVELMLSGLFNHFMILKTSSDGISDEISSM